MISQSEKTNPIQTQFKANFKRAQIFLPPQVATEDLVKILYIVIGSLWRMDYNHHRPQVRKGVTAV